MESAPYNYNFDLFGNLKSFFNFDKNDAMDIHASKLELVKLIVNIENKKIIDKLIKVLKSEEEDFWLELTESEKEEIKLGISQLESGQRISLEDFKKKYS